MHSLFYSAGGCHQIGAFTDRMKGLDTLDLSCHNEAAIVAAALSDHISSQQTTLLKLGSSTLPRGFFFFFFAPSSSLIYCNEDVGFKVMSVGKPCKHSVLFSCVACL